jgi:hypothetical protein
MKAELISKYQKAIQEYVDLIKKGKGRVNSKEVKSLIKRHNVSSTTSTDILRVNIVSRLSRAKYRVNIEKIEPIHARKVIESRREYMNELIHKNKLKDLPKAYKPFQDTPMLETLTNERSISILWGLLKIKY